MKKVNTKLEKQAIEKEQLKKVKLQQFIQEGLQCAKAHHEFCLEISSKYSTLYLSEIEKEKQTIKNSFAVLKKAAKKIRQNGGGLMFPEDLMVMYKKTL